MVTQQQLRSRTRVTPTQQVRQLTRQRQVEMQVARSALPPTQAQLEAQAKEEKRIEQLETFSDRLKRKEADLATVMARQEELRAMGDSKGAQALASERSQLIGERDALRQVVSTIQSGNVVDTSQAQAFISGSGSFERQLTAQTSFDIERARELAPAKLTERERQLSDLMAEQSLAREGFSLSGKRISPQIQDTGPDLFGGTLISKVPEPKTLLEKSQAEISEFRRSIIGEEGIKTGFLGFGAGVLSSGLDLVEFGKEAVTDPVGTGKSVFFGGKEAVTRVFTGEGFPEAGRVLREEPGFATGLVVGEVIQDILLGQVADKFGDLSKLGVTRIDPRFTRVIDEGAGVKNIRVKTAAGDIENIRVVSSIPTESLERQIKRAGQETLAVSAQRDLFGFFDTDKVLRKPIPGEEAFSPKLKNLLKKFDEGKLSSREVVELDLLIKREGAKGILERTFFADPSGELRPSRLGIVQEQKLAGPIDILAGDITFRKPKPQALFFSRANIAELPDTLLDIRKSLREGKSLTQSQQQRLLEFQLTPTGEFKPVGFLTREKEIILSPGEIIRKKRTAGKTIIQGSPVDLVETEIIKASPRLKKLLEKGRFVSLNLEDSKELVKLLKKETGFPQSSVITSVKPILSPSFISGTLTGITSGLFFGASSGILTSSAVSGTAKQTSSLSGVSGISSILKTPSKVSKPASTTSILKAKESQFFSPSPIQKVSGVSRVSGVSKVKEVLSRKAIITKREKNLKEKLKELLKKSRGKSFDVVVGALGSKKERVVAKRLPPFKALKKGSKFTDKNIDASFNLRTNPKKPKTKDIKPFTLGEKFRPSKRNLLKIVEKRRYRLDSPLEKRQIKLIKKRNKK